MSTGPRSRFLKVHDLAVELINDEAILLITKSGASYRVFVPSYRLHNRTAVDPQQDSYQFLTSLQPSVAMLHWEHAWEGGCLYEEGAIKMLEKIDTLKTVLGARE